MLAIVQPEASFPVVETACETVLIVAGIMALAWQIARARREPPQGVAAWKGEWLDFGIWLSAIYCAAYVGVSLFKLFFGDRGLDPTDEFSAILRASAMHSAILVAQLALLWRWRSCSPWPVNQVRLSGRQILREGVLAWLAAYPVVIVASLGWQGIIYLAQKQTAPLQEAVQFLSHARSPKQVAVMLFFAVVIAPMNEELFFRAGLYRFVKSRLPAGYALAAVNLLFAAAHANLLTFLPLFVLGLLLTRLYERCGNIAAPIVFHALFNLTNVALILLFPDSAGPLHPP
jgi:membrane protease YdiL (CAAX protease family)